MKKFMAIAENTKTGQRLVVLPRSKNTGLFADLKTAERALDVYGRRLHSGDWRGLVYSIENREIPALTMAI